MISFVRRYWIVLSLAAAALFTLGTLNYSGMCISERRYLTDQEKFERIVGDMLPNFSRRKRVVEILTGKTGISKMIKYQSAEEYFSINPNCCSFGPTAGNGIEAIPAPSFLDRVLGTASDVIVMRHLVRYIDSQGKPGSIKVGGQAWANACGRYVKWD